MCPLRNEMAGNMTTDVATPFQVDPDTIPPIEIVDRCDKCGARAYVATTIPHPDGLTNLYWCAHHYRQHQEKLEKAAVAVRNEEHKINLKPSVSANAE